jgi:hypothetical protein
VSDDSSYRRARAPYTTRTLAFVAAVALLLGAIAAFTWDQVTKPTTAATTSSTSSVGPTASASSSTPSAAEQACRAAVEKANLSLAQAREVERALAEHTKVMNELLAGKITPQDALNMGMPSLIHGARYSAKFDEAYADYRSVVKTCHLHD